MVSHDIEVVVSAEALLGEGPVWDPTAVRLLWVDIWRHELHRYNPATGEDTVRAMPGEITAVALRNDTAGLIAAIGSDVVVLDEQDAVVERLATLPTGERANDGKPDPRGRFLIGTMALEHPGSAALYRLDGSYPVSVIDGLTISNGLDWSPDDRTMYFADTPTEVIAAFDYDPDAGALSGRRTFIDLIDVPGRPDGLTVDAEGGLWVAMARAGQVRHYDAAGRLQDVIDLPVPRVTSCAFGGPMLDELYVTSGRFDMTPEEIARAPHSGSLFRIRPGVTGRPPHRTTLPSSTIA